MKKIIFYLLMATTIFTSQGQVVIEKHRAYKFSQPHNLHPADPAHMCQADKNSSAKTFAVEEEVYVVDICENGNVYVVADEEKDSKNKTAYVIEKSDTGILEFASGDINSNKLARNPNDSVFVNIISDVQFVKSQSSNIKDGTGGTGNLGLDFEQGLWYGRVVFTVFNQKNELALDDTTSAAPFADNLLVPEKSGKGISSFSFELGRESFLSYDQADDPTHFASFKRFGFFMSYQSNYTTWQKDSIESRIVIQSTDVLLTYKLLDIKIFNSEKDRAYLEVFGGVISRRLGGNFGMEKNNETRTYFLGNDRKVYRSFEFGARFELGNVYAEFCRTNFDGDIDDFSGTQISVSFGIKVDLNVAAKPIK